MKFNGYDIHEAEKKLNIIQTLTKTEFEEWKNKKKWAIARYHYDNNRFYKNLIGNYFPNKWEDLPIMEKENYQIGFNNNLSNGYNKTNTYVSSTTGSTGKPFFFAKNKESHSMDWAVIKNRYSWHGINSKSKQARFWGLPTEIKPLLKENQEYFLF